jgi:rare lipoprotein A
VLSPLEIATAEPTLVVAEAAAPAPSAQAGFMVQAAAFSTLERARNAAGALGGTVSPSGRFFRVRTGPFPTRGEAEASLANVRSAGYSDARILTSG